MDAAIAAVALGVTAGSRPSFDNRISLDSWNLDRIIADHSGRADLLDHVRSQATILCEIADQLSGHASSVLIPVILLSHDALMLDQPILLAGLIDGLAVDHVPVHTQQLLDHHVAVREHS